MFRLAITQLILCMVLLSAIGCSGDSSPVVPNSEMGLTLEEGSDNIRAQTHLWGYYDIYIDVENQTVETVVNRDVMFSANVVKFLNSNPSNLQFNIIDTPLGPDYVDVDIDVAISHPFPGMNEYDGYDVRGVFMGDGSLVLEYNGDLVYPAFGVDQFMLDDPVNYDGGGPDGYTRWYNKPEFTEPGIFGFTPGAYESDGFDGNATFNPYKYFADGLDYQMDLWEFLTGTGDNGVFTSGSTNIRNYYLRFPNSKGVQYGYAVIANWEAEDVHPSNAIEAVACSVNVTPDIYYLDPVNFGGDLILDISLFDWCHQPSTIIVESTVLNTMYEFSVDDMIPTGGGDHYSTWHVEIPADGVTGTEENEYWILADYSGCDYCNDYGVPNLTDPDSLVAGFRSDLYVSAVGYNMDPECDVDMVTVITFPYEGWAPAIEFDASGTFDPDGAPGDIMTFEWDFDGDLVFGDSYDLGTDENPTNIFQEDFVGSVSVRVSDPLGGESTCSIDGVDITAYPTKNIDVTKSGTDAADVALDPTTGDALIIYEDQRIRRYDYSNYYQSYTEPSVGTNDEGQYIDVAENGYWCFGLWRPMPAYSYDMYRFMSYNPSDNYVDGKSWNLYHTYAARNGVEAICMFNTGPSYANDHLAIYGYGNGSGSTRTILIRAVSDPAFPYSWYRYHSLPPFVQYPSYDVSTLEFELITGVEADQNEDFLWFVEKDDVIATRWSITSGLALSYAGPVFGTSNTPTDDNDGLNEPLDITTDAKVHMCVLDELSTGDFVLKAFSYDATTTTPLGSFGESDDWGYDPVRIDGSVGTDGNIVVLCSDGTNASVSLFCEVETPD